MPKAEHPEDGGFFRRFADFGAMPRHLTRRQLVMKAAVSLTSLQVRRERLKEFELSTLTETGLRGTLALHARWGQGGQAKQNSRLARQICIS